MKAIIIPEPKKILLSKGIFTLDKECRIAAGDSALQLSDLLCKEIKTLTNLGLSHENTEIPGMWIKILKKKASIRPKMNYELKRLGEEGYILNIGPNEITIAASTVNGVFYGIQTFLQLLEDSLQIMCCCIKDWPDIPLRGVHFDLKGSMPTFEYLKGAIRQLSRYKINTILLEYEDKLKYDKHPIISSPLALSKEEARELIEIAESCYIQVIPLLQCLGHVDYVLKHKEYRDLSEGWEGVVLQYCPLNPKTSSLVKDLFSEIIPLHNSKYFHIGGDETWLLGSCKKCRAKVKTEGKLKLYLDYINNICKHLKKKGKIPILWDDMISGSEQPELIRELDRNAVIMYWDYHATGSIRTFLRQGQEAKCSREWLKKKYDKNGERKDFPSIWANGWMEEIPKKILKIYKKYWFSKESPLFLNSLPYLKFFQDKCRYVIGASEVRCGKVFPDFERYFLNIREWARQITKYKGLGMVTTSWGRNASLLPPAFPFDITWYLLAASAEYYWSANKSSEEEFDKKFNLRFYGLDNQEVTDAIYLMDKVNKGKTGTFFLKGALMKLKEAKNKAEKNTLNIQLLETACKMLEYKVESKEVFSDIDSFYYQIGKNKIESEIIVICRRKEMLLKLNKLEKRILELKREIQRVFGESMPNSEVEEILDSEYTFDEKRIREFRGYFTRNEF